MARSMYVNVVNEEESRIAIVDEGNLHELSIETSRDELIEGNIYKAKVEKVLPGLDAVFVDYGREKNGFIAMSEVRNEYFANGERKPENLKRGRELMVQVKKGEIGNKGAALTTYISIPGRYLVLMPHVDKRGISRQIESEATRKALHDAIHETSMPEGMGYIVRTASQDQKKQDIQRDVMYLLRMWKRVQTLFEKASGPGLIYREGDLVIRTIRDYFSPEMKELMVDDPKVYERVSAFFRAVMPWHAKKVQLYDGLAPLFTKHNLEAQIASIHEEKVKLPSGGSIVIQQTEALVSVDVNSGAGSKNKDIEATAFITNMEAASETARQLRLRDLGGLIVIDFIDMRSSANQANVKKELQKALKNDKAQTDVGSISKFGLLELSRQRLRRAASPKISIPCPLCFGQGKLRSPESFTLQVLRVVHSVMAKTKFRRVHVAVNPETAAFLYNRKRRQFLDLEATFGAPIEVYAEEALSPNQYYIEFTGDKTRIESNLPPGFPVETLLVRRMDHKTEEEAAYAGVSYEFLTDLGEPEPETEVPEEPRDPEAPAETVVQEARAEEGGQSQPKKRRRRRRRRGGKGSANGDNQPQSAQEEGDEGEDSEDSDEPEAPVAESGDKQPAGDNPEAAAPKKPRRRSRGRKGKKPASAAQAAPSEGAGEAPPPPSAAAEPAGDAPKAEGAPAKKRSRRRGGRGRKKPAGAGSTTPPAAE